MQLHQYQKQAIKHILDNPAAGVFLDMGLGKTVIALTAIRILLERKEIKKVLVIAPLRVAQDVWARELEKWPHLNGLKIAKVLGSAEQRRIALKEEADIYVINRENVSWLIEDEKIWFFDMAVIDELSSFKNPQAKRFKSLRRVRPMLKRIIGLTGTPAPNGLMDLWSQIYLLDRGNRLGKTLTCYREKYFYPAERNGHIVYKWEPKKGAEESIYKAISDICISMRAADWLEVPEKTDIIQDITLDAAAKHKYNTLEKHYLLPYTDADITANTAATLAIKLSQLANGACYDEKGGVKIIHDAKIQALGEIVESAQGKPILVFYSFKHDLQRLKEHFPDCRELQSGKDIDDWNTGKINLLAIHPASCGHGLNLQDGGNIIVWFGLTWSLEMYQQANARLHRQGQKQKVFVYHLIAKGTIDEDIYKILQKKASTQEALMQAVKARMASRAAACL